ncbi:PAS domain-containing protein [Nonomuraea maritima]|uniref:PAS domain-containing protein n=1 Tax=Nonomuraea maritima TaxID=683260 RepID=UPI0015A03375|nr:PAS domain-containing protein [Nonomuraea maritima]
MASPVSGIVEPSPDWQRYTGQTWEEFRGRGRLNAVHPDDREAAAEIWLHEVERESRVAEQIYRVRVPGGAYRHVRVRGVPIVEDGEIVEWAGTVADVEREWQEERRTLLRHAAHPAAHGAQGRHRHDRRTASRGRRTRVSARQDWVSRGWRRRARRTLRVSLARTPGWGRLAA